MGIVYYSRYYEFFEAARTDMLREMGLAYSDFEASGYALPVIESHCKYFTGAKFDEMIIVKCDIFEKPKARLKIEYEVLGEKSGEIIATGHTVHAFLNKKGRACRAPKHFLSIVSLHWEDK